MEKVLRFALLTLVGCLGFWVGAASAIEIVYPADGTYIKRADFLILKGGKEPYLDGVTIEIDGVGSGLIDISSDEYRAAFDDILILQPELEGGRIRLKVEGYVDGKVVSADEAQFFYHSSPVASPPGGYEPYVMHLAEKEAKCAPCHNMNPGSREISSESRQVNPCGSCHGRMLDRKYVHGPAGVMQCAYCHDPSSRPAKYQARVEEVALCKECHLDKIENFRQKKYVHGPIEAGLCSVCHDSHGSAQYAQLVAPVNELCLACHEKVKEGIHVVRGVAGAGHPLEGSSDPAAPERPFNCVSCHDPHGGASRGYFQRGLTSRFALCQICHKK